MMGLTHGRTAATAIVAVAAAVLMAPAGHAQLPACAPGKANSLYCQTVGRQQPAGAQFRGRGPSANVCTSRSARIRLAMRITVPGGLRHVAVTLDGHTIKGQTSGTLRLTINPRQLKVGVHTIRITATSRGGRMTARVLHFRICKTRPVPTFTG